jgi:hypothetical protein
MKSSSALSFIFSPLKPELGITRKDLQAPKVPRMAAIPGQPFVPLEGEFKAIMRPKCLTGIFCLFFMYMASIVTYKLFFFLTLIMTLCRSFMDNLAYLERVAKWM